MSQFNVTIDCLFASIILSSFFFQYNQSDISFDFPEVSLIFPVLCRKWLIHEWLTHIIVGCGEQSYSFITLVRVTTFICSHCVSLYKFYRNLPMWEKLCNRGSGDLLNVVCRSCFEFDFSQGQSRRGPAPNIPPLLHPHFWAKI